MAIEIICKGCARKLRVPDEHAGKQARCPECGTIMPVPASALPTQAMSEMLAAGAPQAVRELWFLQTADGRSYGPVSRAELDRWVAEGRITAQSILRREDQTVGTPATQLYPSLLSSTPAASSVNPFAASANPFADRPAAGPANPYIAPTSYGSSRAGKPHRGGLVLAFGLLGLMLCCFFGIAAWVMAANDLREMKTGLMDPSGQGLTQAGMILGIISCALQAIPAILIIIGALAG